MSRSPSDLIRYLSGLTVSQGRLAGWPLTVLPWQRRFVRGAFALGVQSAGLSVARGNGKTVLLSGIAAATLDGPLMVPRGETVIVASSFEQGRIAFEHVAAFMGDALRDRKRWRVWDTAQLARIENLDTGARVRCIRSDPRRAHGLAPVLVLPDEPAQWPESTGERMVAALRTAAGKQPHSRFVALGTRPADETHWFAKMLAGGADYAQCHAAKPDDPKIHKRSWAKANPSLPAMPDLLAAIRTEAGQARRDPALLASFEALRFNLGTPDTESPITRCASVGVLRRRGGRFRAGGVGSRSWYVVGAIRYRGVLAGDRADRVRGGVSVRSDPGRAGLARWRRRALWRVRPARRIAYPSPCRPLSRSSSISLDHDGAPPDHSDRGPSKGSMLTKGPHGLGKVVPSASRDRERSSRRARSSQAPADAAPDVTSEVGFWTANYAERLRSFAVREHLRNGARP